MKCSCPKCSSPLPEDLDLVPDKGKNPKCPECGQRYWIHREPFVLRAYYVDGRRYCVACGEDIALGMHCPGCGQVYPDYCVVQLKKPVRRESGGGGLNFDFSWGGRKKKAAPVYVASGGGETVERARPAFHLNPTLVKLSALLLLVALLAGGGLWFMGRKVDRDYPQQYVFALYLLKAGSEQGVKMSAMLAGGTRLGEKELQDLSRTKKHIDEALAKITPPPGDYAASHERLSRLNDSYNKLYELCSTSGPSPRVGEAATKIDNEFTQNALAIKGALSPDLVEALKGALPKYRNLKFLVE